MTDRRLAVTAICTRRRVLTLSILSAALLGCGTIDAILEAEQLAELSMSIDSLALTIPSGGEQTMGVRVKPIGDRSGAVTITPGPTPSGVTMTVTDVARSGIVTTANVTVRVGANVTLGHYDLKLYAKASRATDGVRVLGLTVISPPAYTVSLSRVTFTVAKGGSAPFSVQLTRTNFSQPVSLALAGAPIGMSVTVGSGSITSSSAVASLSVASTVAPGSYAITLRAIAAGLPDRTVPLTVNVTADPIQLLATGDVTTPQATSVSTDVLINRGDGVTSVTLSAEGLPAGVTASFDNANTTNPKVTMTLAMGPAAEVGSYLIAVRATAPDVADATTTVGLTVTEAKIAIALSLGSMIVYQTTNSSAVLTIARTQFAGSVAIVVDGAPTGVSVTATPTTTTGSTSTIRVQATATATPGTHELTVRAVPAGLAAAKTQTTTLSVSVRAAPAGGNVLLDWTGCGAPPWIASLDGTGAWTRVLPVGDLASFNVGSGRGGYAWADGGVTVTARFALQSELTGAPIQMCPSPQSAFGTKWVTGTAVHGLVTEQWSYQLGGGSGSSTGTNPTFTISSVRDGAHDLIVTGTTALQGARAIIRRGLDLPSGSMLESVNLAGPEGFAPTSRTMTINGTFLGGEALSYAFNYLTTPACVENRLAGAAAGTSTVINAMPPEVQALDDYHELVVTSASITSARTASVAFRTAANKTVTLPNATSVPVVSNAGSIAYRRLGATVVTVPAVYNGPVTFTYSFGAQSMTASATIGYAGVSNVRLEMPDFTAVAGWSPVFAIPAGSQVAWRFTAEGTNGLGPRCTEGRTAVQASRSGTF